MLKAAVIIIIIQTINGSSLIYKLKKGNYIIHLHLFEYFFCHFLYLQPLSFMFKKYIIDEIRAKQKTMNTNAFNLNSMFIRVF